ncbi:MAG: carbohydrate ABC transporter permease [Chloroflexi bacterium]|nr:carbohydrate ABC transporter permease [Chloroflexota bacterium]
MLNHAKLRSAPGHGVLTLLCLLTVFPMLWAVLTSLKPVNEIFTLDLVTANATLANYAEVYRAVPFLRMMLNTLIVATVMMLLTLALSIAVAYAITRWEFPGKRLVYLAFAGSLLIPFQVTMIPNYLLIARLGWLNTLPGLIVPQLGSTIGVGLGVLILRQHFIGFPKSLLDAAAIDGAGPIRTLWSVLLPNMRPALAAVSILIFLQAWNEYFWPLLVTKKMDDTMIQVGLQLFLQAEGNAWGPLMAAATMSAVPVFALYFLAQRQIMDAFVRSGIR